MKRLAKAFVCFAALGMCFSVAACGESSTPMSEFERQTRDIYESGLREGSIQDQTYEEWLVSIRGQDGKDGHTPDIKIGANGNWFIDGVDTGVRAQGPQGEPGQDGNPGKDGENGKPGQDGVSVVSILKTGTSEDGLVDTYTITYSNGNTSTFTVTNGKDGENGQDGQSIQGNPGKDGHTPVITISEDGYWVIDDNKTNQKAQGEIGPEGPQGETGADGTSVLTGHGVPNNDTGKDGDSYVNLDNWDFYVRDSGVWTKQGNIKGEQGNPGADGSNGTDGTNGSDGKSAYELYCDAHPEYTGTEEEWLDMILDGRRLTMSGNCGDLGDNVVWKLYNDGKLEFDGQGPMKQYMESTTFITGGQNIPWSCFGSCVNEAMVNEGITTLCNYAFMEMSSIEHIHLPDSLQQIGFCAFRTCSNLIDIEIPNNVMFNGLGAFMGCVKLTSVTLPNSISRIEENEFLQCYSLPSITIPSGVTGIEWYAFAYCSSLSSVTLPENLEYIRPQAFEYCTSLETIDIPNNVTEIGHTAFGHSALTSIVIPNSVVSLGAEVFENCLNLTSVTLPEELTSIDFATFIHCENLPNIVIPNTVTSLGSSAFCGCYSLNNIIIPKSVTLIDEYCFDTCSSLTNLSYDGTMEEWNAVELKSGWRRNTPLTIVHCSDGDVTL